MAHSNLENTPSGRRLFAYWVRGKGRQRWINSPHPFTTLWHLLMEESKGQLTEREAKGLAANIFNAAVGHYPSARNKGERL